MSNNLEEENVVEQIISTIKNGDVLPYKLVNKFLTLENGNTTSDGRLNPYGVLGNQLKGAVSAGIMSMNLCAETIGREEEIHQKLLRILREYSKDLIDSADSTSAAERISENVLRNYYTIIYGRDNIPMDENGDLPENYRKSVEKLVSSHKKSAIKTEENKDPDFDEVK